MATVSIFDLKVVTNEEVDNALQPLLKKIADALPKKANVSFGRADLDGGFMRFESTTKQFKVLGSEYHPHTQLAYLNIVTLDHWHQAASRATLVEQVEVDGSEDLAAGFMEHYDWLLEVTSNLVES